MTGSKRTLHRTWLGFAAQRGSLSAIIVALCSLLAAAAEGPQPVPLPSDANVITVRPSGVDARTVEARLAEERLERRLKRSDQALRAICVGCGSRDAVAGAMPFSPIEALHPPANAPSQMLLSHPLPDEVTVEIRQVPVAGPEQPAPPPASNPP